MVASHLGHHTDLADLRRQFFISLKGATLAQLMRHASSMHLNSRPLRLELDEMSELALPCILHWNLNHFVVLKKVKKDMYGRMTLILLDPAVSEHKPTHRKKPYTGHYTLYGGSKTHRYRIDGFNVTMYRSNTKCV